MRVSGIAGFTIFIIAFFAAAQLGRCDEFGVWGILARIFP